MWVERLSIIRMAHLPAVTNQARPRVLALDDTAMTTQLLFDALGRDAQFQMIESPSDLSNILPLVKREKPEIVLISANLSDPKRGGFEMVRQVRTESPSSRVIVLIDYSEPGTVTEAFRAGAQGVFCRTEPFKLLAKCIQCVANGEVWASRSELQFILESLAQPGLSTSMNLAAGVLSARETDVVRCVAEGLTNRDIAQRLKLTEHTVKNYLFRIFDKLGVSSRVEVALYAIRNSGPNRNSAAPSRKLAQPPATPEKIAAQSTTSEIGSNGGKDRPRSLDIVSRNLRTRN